MERPRIPQSIASQIEKLYVAEYSKLFSRARLLTQGDPYAAEDLVQQVFEAMACAFSTVPQDDQGRRAWLFRVLTYKAVDRWRQESRILLEPALLENEPSPSPFDDDLDGFSVDAHTIERLWKEMQDMPPAQYRVAYLDWVCNLPTRVIADTLDITPSTVRVHRRNAVRQLRKILALDPDSRTPPEKPTQFRKEANEGLVD